MTTQATHISRGKSVPFTSNPGAMAVVTTIFFMWGLITVLNDILIPHLKAIFSLDYTQVMMVQFCFFSAYFVFAYPFGKLVERIGYQKTMVTGLCTSAVGALLFLPAALVASFPIFLGALIVVAAGITGLQVAANPYVSILGNPASASSRLNLAQALNSLGTTIAPYVGGILILGAAAAHLTPVQEAHSVIAPYVGLAAVLFALAAGVAMIRLPKMLEMTEARHEGSNADSRIWNHRHTMLGAIGIFLYVGAEVSIGSFLVNYFGQSEIGGLKAETAAKFVSLYWGGAMIGRFIGSALLRKIKAGVALGWVATVACLLVITSMLTTGHIAMAAIILVGLFNSVMFPNIFTLGIADLGPLTGEGSGLLIAAIVGGAIIPVMQGALADRIGIHHAFILPVLCYLYIVYYGLRGSKPDAVPSQLCESPAPAAHSR
jgi:FHS family L-fucose permease-like MFS transporter